MKLNQLRDFIAMADHGSMRSAARTLGVSAPALGKSIAQLELELQVPLLVRSARGVVLSDYGRTLLERARLIDSEARRAGEEIAQLRGRHEGAVTIGASPTPGITIVPAVIAQFRRKFPAVNVSLVSGLYHSHVPRLRNGSMDLAIGPVPADGLAADLSSEPLFYNDVVIVARKRHPLAAAESLAQLVDGDWAVTGPSTQGPGAAIFDAFRQHGLPTPRHVVQCDITWALQSLLEGSDLLCALPRQLVDHLGFGASLRVLPIREALPRYVVSLYRLRESPMLPGAAHFAVLLRRHAHYLCRARPEMAIRL
jgi:LysR family transcriptional regulator of abg operon